MIRDTAGREWDERLVLVDQDGRIWRRPSRVTGDPAPAKGLADRLPMWIQFPAAVAIICGAALLHKLGVLRFKDDQPLGQMECVHK